MTHMIKSVLKKLGGVIGILNFQKDKSKKVMGIRSHRFIHKQNIQDRLRRERFRMSTKLASAIYSVELLRSQWKKLTPKKFTVFNYILKINYSNIVVPDMSRNIVLIPGFGFSIPFNSKQILTSEICFNVDQLGDRRGINVSNEVGIMFVAVIFLSNPSRRYMQKYDFIAFESEKQELRLDTPLHFNIPFLDIQEQYFAKYRSKKGFYILLTLDKDDRVIHHSNTFFHDMDTEQ